MTPDTEPASPAAPPRKKPQISFLLATWFGFGYLPKAPGTWGSLAGVIVTWVIQAAVGWIIFTDFFDHDRYFPAYSYIPASCCLVVACVGVWASSRVTAYTGTSDPQFVVIDEVSGQMLTLILAEPTGGVHLVYNFHAPWGTASVDGQTLTYLFGFLLFRFFDILKPFPIRRLEKLPRGWGIMADDWLAGIYAAIVLRLALHFNLI
jgi:phosphatidylglycerophosphatase A